MGQKKETCCWNNRQCSFVLSFHSILFKSPILFKPSWIEYKRERGIVWLLNLFKKSVLHPPVPVLSFSSVKTFHLFLFYLLVIFYPWIYTLKFIAPQTNILSKYFRLHINCMKIVWFYKKCVQFECVKFTSLFFSLWPSCCLLFLLHARDDDVTWCNFLSCSTTRMCDSSNMFTLFFFCACRMLFPSSYSYSLKISVKNVTEKKVSCKGRERERNS